MANVIRLDTEVQSREQLKTIAQIRYCKGMTTWNEYQNKLDEINGKFARLSPPSQSPVVVTRLVVGSVAS